GSVIPRLDAGLLHRGRSRYKREPGPRAQARAVDPAVKPRDDRFLPVVLGPPVKPGDDVLRTRGTGSPGQAGGWRAPGPWYWVPGSSRGMTCSGPVVLGPPVKPGDDVLRTRGTGSPGQAGG